MIFINKCYIRIFSYIRIFNKGYSIKFIRSILNFIFVVLRFFYESSKRNELLKALGWLFIGRPSHKTELLKERDSACDRGG